MNTIVGLIGKKGSGKTAVANYFINNGYKRDFLAKPIKEAAKILFNFTDDQVYGDQKEMIDPRYGFAPRKILQIVGTEWCQIDLQKRFTQFEELVGRNHWANMLCERISKSSSNKNTLRNYIVDDVRFPHEIKRLKEFSSNNEFKFVTIRINRNGVDTSDRHASEVESDNIEADFDLDNNGTLEQTYRKLEDMIKLL